MVAMPTIDGAADVVRPAGVIHARARRPASRAPWPPTVPSGLQWSTPRNLACGLEAGDTAGHDGADRGTVLGAAPPVLTGRRHRLPARPAARAGVSRGLGKSLSFFNSSSIARPSSPIRLTTTRTRPAPAGQARRPCSSRRCRTAGAPKAPARRSEPTAPSGSRTPDSAIREAISSCSSLARSY